MAFQARCAKSEHGVSFSLGTKVVGSNISSGTAHVVGTHAPTKDKENFSRLQFTLPTRRRPFNI